MKLLFKNKFFQASNLKNKHFLALVGNGIISVFSVLTIFVLYRALEKTEIGTWFFFITCIGLADSIRNGFLTTATVKFYAGTSPERGREVLGSVWFLASAITAVALLVNAIALPFVQYIHKPEMKIVIQWFGITYLSTLPTTVAAWILIADEDYLKMLWLRFINSGSMIGLILVYIFLHKGSLQNILIINLFTNCLTSAVIVLQGLSKFQTLRYRSKSTILELVQFGKYSLATNASTNLLGSANTFIITFFLGPAALAVYNLPQRLMEFIEIPLRSFVGTGLSAMAAAHNNKQTHMVSYISKKYAGMLTLAFIPISLVAFVGADLATQLLGGSKYIGTEAPNILRIFMFIAILYPIDRFNGITLDVINHPKVNFYKVLIMMAVNISTGIGGILLLHNLYGVALATPFTLLAGLLFGYHHLKKHLNGYSFRGIIRTGIIETKLLLNKILHKK